MATINSATRTLLQKRYPKFINNTTLNMFEQKSPELVRMLNAYKGSFSIHPISKSASFDFTKQLIQISDKYSIHDFYLSLAHELGHATGTQQSHLVSTHKTGIAYSDNRARAEGEAMYYEFLVSKELNIVSDFIKRKGNNVFKILNDNNITLNKKFDELGKLNQNMYPSTQGNQLVKYNYDESNIAWFLAHNTNIQKDYKEVMNHDLIPFIKNSTGGYDMNLHHHTSNIYRIKSLTNRNNHFFSHHKQDTHTTHDTFSNNIGMNSLAQKNGEYDVLYGGKGNDKITGSSAKEIILGGDGVDHLSGNSGNDILGGNSGNDTLYGGVGSDSLHGGSGFDKYIFTAQDIAKSTDIDTIRDKGTNQTINNAFDGNNRGEIIIAGVSLHKANWVAKGNGIWQATDQKWQLQLSGTDWRITGMQGSSLKSTIIVADAALTSSAFGLTLSKIKSASSSRSLATTHNHNAAIVPSAISAANNLIIAMNAFGNNQASVADDLATYSQPQNMPLLAVSTI